jgi:hypothetical protein
LVKEPSDHYIVEKKQSELKSRYGSVRVQRNIYNERQWEELRSELVQAFRDNDEEVCKKIIGKMYYHKLEIEDG